MTAPAQPRRTTGIVVAGSALLAQWLLHLLAPEAPFAPLSVGEWFVRRAPGAIATAAIEALGHHAMDVVAVVAVAVAIALGYAAGRFHPAVHGVIALLGTVVAVLIDPSSPRRSIGVLSAFLTAGVAMAVSALQRRPHTTAADHAAAGDAVGSADSADMAHAADAATTERRALIAAGALLSVAAVVGVGVLRRVGRAVASGFVRIDKPAVSAANPDFDAIAGLSPVVTSRQDHYTVDIDFLDPGVDGASWRLHVGGAVDRPQALSLDELRALPNVERHATLSCISNEVGGDLVGSARWTGVPLADLLQRAGVQRGAVAVEAVAADGYSDSIPIAIALDPSTLVAFGMNGALLPRAHGFPARLRIPSRYGMKNVKWLQAIHVLTADRDGYWELRGWDRTALVRTESRIDTPRDGTTIGPAFTIAGVAWAGDRGVRGVEVSTDGGATWRSADLDRPGDPLAWRRWRTAVALPAGPHALVVRATDGTGVVQTNDHAPPHPSGATGWHRVDVTVRP